MSAQIFNYCLPPAINELKGLFFLCLQDPSVIQHSSNTGYATLDLYNPFDNNTTAVNISVLTIVSVDQAVFTKPLIINTSHDGNTMDYKQFHVNFSYLCSAREHSYQILLSLCHVMFLKTSVNLLCYISPASYDGLFLLN